MNRHDFRQKVKDLLIVRENDGSYNLFGKYFIHQSDGNYTVTLHNEPDEFTFSTLKYAVTWCIFEKQQKNKDIKRIADLDTQLASSNVSILQYKRLIEKNKTDDVKYIYMAKLSEEKIKKSRALKELNDYALTSKYWQSKKYDENKG